MNRKNTSMLGRAALLSLGASLFFSSASFAGGEGDAEAKGGAAPAPARQQAAPLLNLDMNNVSVREALEVVFKSTRSQYTIDNDVKGTVSLKVENQPLETILPLILRAATPRATYTVQNGVYVVRAAPAAMGQGGQGGQQTPEETKEAIRRLEQEIQRLKERAGMMGEGTGQTGGRTNSPGTEGQNPMGQGQTTGDPSKDPMRPTPTTQPFTVRGDVAFRFDLADRRGREIGLLPEDESGNFRNRTRIHVDSAIRNNANAVASFTTVTAQNPAAPYLTLGDGFRGKVSYFRSFYINYYFLRNKEERPSPYTPTLIVGKMDNPFWRAQTGLPPNPTGSGIPNYFIPNFQSEIAWDFDVTPEGAFARIPLRFNNRDGDKIDLQSAYFQINSPNEERFTGDTSDLYQIYSQVHLVAGSFQASFQHNYVRNLNSGLHNPIFDQTGIGIERTGATSAFLLRPPFQATNGHYGVNNNVFTFARDTFNIFGGTVQYTPSKIKLGGGVQPFFVGEYLNNSSIDFANEGYGLSLGVNRGTNKRDNFGAWVTYRDVDADATLGPFADSDLGGGTDFRGYQVGLLYHLQDSLIFRAAWHEFKGYPKKNNGQGRLLIDIVKLF